MLKIVSKNTEKMATKESLIYLRLITEMLRITPEPTLKTLITQLSQGETIDQSVEGAILLDMLPHIGTEAAANVVLDVCTDYSKLTEKCVSALNVLTLTVTPTPTLINKLINMIYTIRPDPRMTAPSANLRQVLYLTLGSWGFKLTEARNSQWEQLNVAATILKSLERDNQRYIRRMVFLKKTEIKEKRKLINDIYNDMALVIMDELRKLVEEGTMSDKILGLKAIGNSGLPQTLPVIKSIAMKTSEPTVLRVLAISAYRRVTASPVARHVAIKDLESIILSDIETSVIRTTAFSTLLSLKPSLPVIEKIAHKMRNEKDIYVSTYVIGRLQAVANSTYDPFHAEIRNLTIVLQAGPTHPLRTNSSAYIFAGKYIKTNRMGISAKVNFVDTLETSAISNIDIESYIYGLHSKLFEIGFDPKSISEFLTRAFGRDGILSNAMSSLKNTRDTKTLIKKVLEEMSTIRTGQVYVSVMGHEMRYIAISDILREIIPTGEQVSVSFQKNGLKSTIPVDIKRLVCNMDIKLALPTEAGIPVSLQMHVSNNMRITGDITLGLEASSSGRTPMPKGANLELNIKPQIAFGISASMGMDHFFLKPTIGFHSFIGFDMPVHQEYKVDLEGMTTRVVSHVTEQKKPIVQTTMEPFSDFLIITSTPNTPVIDVNFRPIYVPEEERTVPVFYNLPIPLLGWKVYTTGQIPITTPTSCQHIFYSLNGRTIVSIWMTPLEGAAKTIPFEGKLLRPTPREPITDDFASFATELFDSIEDSEETETTQTISTTQQLAEKLEKITGKPIPTTLPAPHGLILTLNASTETETRTMQLESLVSGLTTGHIKLAKLRIWRSAIPRFNLPMWQVVSEFESTTPVTTIMPESVYSTEWQRILNQDIMYQIKSDSYKMVNQILNTTINSLIQSDATSITQRLTPATRVLKGVIPEVLLRVMKLNSPFSRNWRMFWQKLGPIFDKVTEESTLLVDPEFTNRDSIVTELINALVEVQQMFVNELKEIAAKRTMVHSEVPIMQWVALTQGETFNILREIVIRYKVNGAITQIAQIEKVLGESSSLAATINRDILKVLTTVNVVTGTSEPVPLSNIRGQDKEILGEIVKSTTQHSQKVSSIIAAAAPITSTQTTSAYPYITSKTAIPSISELPQLVKSEVDSLHHSILHLAIHQQMIITHMQEKITEGKKIDVQALLNVVNATITDAQLVDLLLTLTPITNQTLINNVLLMTVQNEYIIKLWQSYWNVRPVRSGEEMAKEVYCDKLLKEMEIGNSTDMQYRHILINDRVNVNLSNPIFFEEYLKHMTSMISSKTEVLSDLVGELEKLPGVPNVYLTTYVPETINYLKAVAEKTRTVLLTTTHSSRPKWETKLEEQITTIQTTISKMSPVFEKYVNIIPSNQTPTTQRQTSLSQRAQLSGSPRIPDGIYSTLNITWGTDGELDRKALVKISATRSVEQIMWLFRQLDGHFRSQEIVKGVNMRLRETGEMTSESEIANTLNTFNHVHLAVVAQPEHLPKWVKQLAIVLQEHVKFNGWPYYTRLASPTFLSTKKAEVIADISQFNEKTDITVLTAEETNKFIDLPTDQGVVFPFVKTIAKHSAVPMMTREVVPLQTAQDLTPSSPITNAYVSQGSCFDYWKSGPQNNRGHGYYYEIEGRGCVEIQDGWGPNHFKTRDECVKECGFYDSWRP